MAIKHEIDNIAKYTQQRRSPAPKPRTDFSFFLLQSSSPPSSSQDSMRESSSANEVLSTSSIATSNERKSTSKDKSRHLLVQCNNQVPKEGGQNSRRQLFRGANGSNTSNGQDQSCDRQNSSGSVQSESNFNERRRGKRTRKPKLHFDETSIQLSSGRKARRLKIMRYLGLIAPVGSPFSLNHV